MNKLIEKKLYQSRFNKGDCIHCGNWRKEELEAVLQARDEWWRERIREKVEILKLRVFCKCGKLKEEWYDGELKCPTYNIKISLKKELWNEWYEKHSKENEYGNLGDLQAYRELVELLNDKE